MKRKRVAIESPLRGSDSHTRKENDAFVRAVCRWAAMMEDVAPFAMHIGGPEYLDDDKPEERMVGMEVGNAWAELAEEVWYCLRPDDLGPSSGMISAHQEYVEPNGIPWKVRCFGKDGTPYTFSTLSREARAALAGHPFYYGEAP